jgi:hypothetical protein
MLRPVTTTHAFVLIDSCCTGSIRRGETSCDVAVPPCNVNTTGGDPTCEHGKIGGADDDLCCAASCDKCSGSGCSAGDISADDCCAGRMRRAALTCNTNEAPCIIELGSV